MATESRGSLTAIGETVPHVLPPKTLSSSTLGEMTTTESRERERDLRTFRAGLPPKFRNKHFADFDPNPDRKALTLARRFAAACNGWFEAGRPDHAGPMLFLTSERQGEVIAPGNGKSLLAACVLTWLAENGRLRIYEHERTGERWPNLVFVTSVDLISEVRSTYGNRDGRTPDEVVGKYLAADVLVLDDIGTEPSGEDATVRMFQVLDKRRRPTIFTSNYSLDHLRQKSPEWAKHVSRIREKMIGAVLTGPDRREPESDPWAEWLPRKG